MSMYLEFYGLDREPFTIAPDPAFLYPSNYHRQALAHLKYGLDREGGFILLTGEVGTGKTTLTRMLLDQLPANVRVAYILNAKLGAEDVLASICHELGVNLPSGASGSVVKLAVDAMNQDLLVTHAQGRKTLVVIEEAQNLSADVLEVLRLLTNLETDTHKLLHILLVGQPELLELLGQQQLRQLNQRVVSRYHLQPLDRSELEGYLNHRLRRAGARNALFDKGSIGALYKLSRGIPRLVNLIAQHALIASYSLGRSMVTATVLKKAAAEILGTDVRVNAGGPVPAFPPRLAKVAIVLALLGLAYVVGKNQGVGFAFTREPAALRTVDSVNSGNAAAGTGDDSILVNQVHPVQVVPPVDTVSAKTGPEEAGTVLAVKPETQPEASNPFAELLGRAQIPTAGITGEAQFCTAAARDGLQCGRLERANIDALLSVNRVGIAWLTEGVASMRANLVTGYRQGRFSLFDGVRELELSDSDFITRWNGTFLYLWQPPPGYRQELRQGSVNAPLLDWLQDRLQKLDAESERLITGGRYTEAVRQQVTRFQQANNLLADGILGPQTILKLNQRTGTRVPLLIGEES